MGEVQEQKTGNGGGKCCLTCGCITVLVIVALILAIAYGVKYIVNETEPYLANEPRQFSKEVLGAEETKQAVRDWNTFSDNLTRKRASITLNEKQINSIIAHNNLQKNIAVSVGENDVVVSFAFKFPLTEKYADCDVTFTPEGDRDFSTGIECFGEEKITDDMKKALNEAEYKSNFNIDLFKIENGEVTIEVSRKGLNIK